MEKWQYLTRDGETLDAMKRFDIPFFPLGSSGPVTRAYREQGVHNFVQALEWTHRLPYRRNSDRTNYMLIFKEKYATCSTKHAALAALCRENNIPIKLQMAIIKLDIKLMPKVKKLLEKLGVDFFPEAHCYLQYENQNIDVTFASQPPILKAEVLELFTIEPEQIGEYKLALHFAYLRVWMRAKKLDQRFSFEEMWDLREQWIDSL